MASIHTLTQVSNYPALSLRAGFTQSVHHFEIVSFVSQVNMEFVPILLGALFKEIGTPLVNVKL